MLRIFLVSLAILATQLLLGFLAGTLLRRAASSSVPIDRDAGHARVLKLPVRRPPRRISGPRRAVG